MGTIQKRIRKNFHIVVPFIKTFGQTEKFSFDPKVIAIIFQGMDS